MEDIEITASEEDDISLFKLTPSNNASQNITARDDMPDFEQCFQEEKKGHQ